MKKITNILVCILSIVNFGLTQNIPIIATGESCVDSPTGQIEIIFNNDFNAFPFPYSGSYYNSDNGDYGEFIIKNNPFIINNLLPGEYEIEVWIENKTIMELCAIVESYQLDIQFNQSSDCGSGGSIEVITENGSGDYTYVWEDDPFLNSPIRENLGEGLYTVRVIEENDCEATASVYVKPGTDFDPDQIPSSFTNPTCNVNNGVIKLFNYQQFNIVAFEWSTGDTGDKIDNLLAGDYSVTLWNDEGCKHDLNFKLEDIGAPYIANSLIEYSCENSNNGVIGIIAYSSIGSDLKFSWSNGAEGQIIENLPVGEYCVTITDTSNECYTSECYFIDAIEEEISLGGDITNNCSSSDDAPTGSIQAMTSGGTKPYSYKWSNGFLGSNPQDLSAGTYTLTLTDQCGETAISTYTVIDYKVEIELSADLNQGETTISSTTSGEAPFDYIWNTSDESSSIVISENGTYSVTVTDATGCSSSQSILIDNDCPSLLINLHTSLFTASCSSSSLIRFVAPVSGTYPMVLSISLDGETVENTILESNSEVLDYEFYNQGNSGNYEISVIDNCGNTFTESWLGCLTCDYESGINGEDPYVTLFKEYITLSQECPCDNDCGLLGFTTDKIKLEVDESGLLNDPSLPSGSFSFKIVWPGSDGEITSISKVNINSNGAEIKINGIEEYVLSDEDYEGEDNDENTGGSVNVTVQYWSNNGPSGGAFLDCEVTIPFSFGELGLNGWFSKLEIPDGTFDPFGESIYNIGTMVCETKCTVPQVTGILYANEPIDENDERRFDDDCKGESDYTLKWYRYLPNTYDDPCFGGGVLESYFETETGLVRGIKTIPAGVALGHTITPYVLFSENDHGYGQFSCPPYESEKGYCLFDGFDVYGVNLRDNLLVEYCEDSFYDPPVDTDGDGIPDEEDPCPLDPDTFCDPSNNGGGNTGTGGGGTNSEGCKVSFYAEPGVCEIITYCVGESPVTQTGTITTQYFGGVDPCVHCFTANICNVVDASTDIEYSGLVGSVDNENIGINTSFNENNNCGDECTIFFTCNGEELGWKCGGSDCTTQTNPICSYSQLEDIIDNSLTSDDGSSVYVRSSLKTETVNFEISPNPSTGSIVLDIISNSNENKILIISTVEGQKLYTYDIPVNIGQNKVPLDINLNEGIYMISLISNKEIKTIKHVVQK